MQDAAIPSSDQPGSYKQKSGHAASNHRSEGRWQLYLVILIPSLAMGLAWYLYFFGVGFVPDGRTNKGELLLPPASFQSMNLSQNGQTFDIEQIDGKWGIVVIGESGCTSDICQESLYQTRQAHVALGRETDRVVRLFISGSGLPASSLQEEHPEVFWLKADKASVLETLKKTEWPANRYYIVDPLGNIMMQYEAGQYGRDLIKDLQKLLKASSIG
ncbi:hypothetical protein EOPP23_10120 [Endozoicomonas sp. OPT23]|uniref:SCO family protein n=1 Tax=Endozoicomonas sp. OPT23 TaxID=2072845 RepID=UPI001890DD7B|nr:hypothetical protein [Endozoicomonas sp. OPT23]MRI33339.1 hypothetical protein [Endozoicomonas sp. OPT23]